MVSIILPTYNEKENIIDLIEELYRNVKQPLEVIVVDDDSPDKTWKLVGDYNKPDVRVIRRIGERGLATAIDRGLKESRGNIVGWNDADGCHPPHILAGMLEHLSGYDIVIGSRYVLGGRDARGFFRVATSAAINWFAGLLLGFDIRDYDSGFIVLKKDVFNKVSFPSRGYGDYFIEFIYRCKKMGFRIKEVPFVFRERVKGSSKSAPDIFGFIKLGFGYILRIIYLRLSVRK